MGYADELKNVIAAGPFTWDALDELEDYLRLRLKTALEGYLDDPGLRGMASTSLRMAAGQLQGDLGTILMEVGLARSELTMANQAWENALRKYQTFEDQDEDVLGRVAVGFMTGGISEIIDLFGEDDDDRGEDGLHQLERDLAFVDEMAREPDVNSLQSSGQVGEITTGPNIPGMDQPDLGDGLGGGFGGVGGMPPIGGYGNGLAIDGAGAIAGAGGLGGLGGAGVGGAGVGGGIGAGGAALGGVGLLGAGAASGAAAKSSFLTKGGLAGGGMGMMGGGGGGGADDESLDGPSGSAYEAPELDEDDDGAPRSEGAAAGGRGSSAAPTEEERPNA